MRNVLIDGRILGYRYGGIATYARQLALRIPRLSSNLNLSIALRRQVLEFDDRSIQTLTPPHHRFERVLLGLEITARQPDLVHSVDYVTPVTRGPKTVATVHDLAFLEHPELVTADSYAYYSQIHDALPTTDRVIAVSPATRDRLIERLNLQPEQVTMIPNGYDDATFQPGVGNDMRLIGERSPFLARAIRDERPIVLAVGTVEPRKRYEILMDALENQWAEICRLAGTEPVVVIAGQSGWLSDELVARMRHQATQGRLVWIRDCVNDELAALYRQAKLLVMPSIDEGFGLPVLEAMASGTPSLVANTGALPWLVADSGFIEDTDVASAWAEKIGMILADNEMRQLRGKRGISRSATFTWDETARQTAKLYEEVMNER